VLGLVVISTGTHRIKHIAYLDKLAINQSLGLGTIFFQEIISSLHAEVFTKIELGAEVNNKRAISFGFVIEGVRKNLLNREGEFVDN
jgi:ribosomal protein S18 acetylase RimI-like enzyme